MRTGGVQKPDSLGMKVRPSPTGSTAEVERHREREEARQTIDALQQQVRDLDAAAALYRDDAQALWKALRTVTAAYRRLEQQVDGEVVTAEVQAAMAMLVERNHEPRPVCPECVQGKHPNCTREVLTDDDEMVPCGCESHG